MKEWRRHSEGFKGSCRGQSEDSCPDVFLSKQHLFLIQTENTDSLIFHGIVPKRGRGEGGGGRLTEMLWIKRLTPTHERGEVFISDPYVKISMCQ